MRITGLLAAGATAALFGSAWAATPAPAPKAPAGGGIPLGAYECWGNGSPRMLMNFTVTAPGKYKASDNSLGTFTVAGTGAERTVTFKGYMQEVLPAGFKAVYHEPQGHPTVSFRGPSGAEAQYCEKVRT